MNKNSKYSLYYDIISKKHHVFINNKDIDFSGVINFSLILSTNKGSELANYLSAHKIPNNSVENHFFKKKK